MAFILVLHDHCDEVECAKCDDSIPHPYLDVEEVDDDLEYVCSACDAKYQERKKRERQTEAHTPTETLPPAICECGFTLDKCTAGTCKGPALPKKPLQGHLF